MIWNFCSKFALQAANWNKLPDRSLENRLYYALRFVPWNIPAGRGAEIALASSDGEIRMLFRLIPPV
jgi:hypothetical protein